MLAGAAKAKYETTVSSIEAIVPMKTVLLKWLTEISLFPLLALGNAEGL
jgi:hypothetical protein